MAISSMNKIQCIITDIISDEHIALVSMHSKDHIFTAMILDHHLEVGMKVNALFKESEVMICDSSYSKISARNRFVSKVLSVHRDKTIARVLFEFEGGVISSLVSSVAIDEMMIAEGLIFGWFVKSSEVMIEYV